MRAGAGDRAAGKLKRHAGGTHHVRPTVHLSAKRMKGVGTEDEQQTGIKQISDTCCRAMQQSAHAQQVRIDMIYQRLDNKTRSLHAFLPGGFQWLQQRLPHPKSQNHASSGSLAVTCSGEASSN